MLDAVAALLAARPEILLVRIEAFAPEDPGADPRAPRRAVEATQARADAVFRYLWRHGGVSAERLEPVGLGWDGRRGGRGWQIELRVIARR